MTTLGTPAGQIRVHATLIRAFTGGESPCYSIQHPRLSDTLINYSTPFSSIVRALVSSVERAYRPENPITRPPSTSLWKTRK